MSLLNAHLFGADPEFVILDGKAIVPYRARAPLTAPWGTDHGGFVIEPHPKPEMSIRKLVDNLKVSFNDFATVAPEGKWRAGAFVSGTTPRNQALGGHIHIDKPKPAPSEVVALDRLSSYLEKLDILPTTECQMRRDTSGYGRAGDVRSEHGHWEYRSLPSWLYSQRVTKLCLVGAKLASLEPTFAQSSFNGTPSLNNLKKFYESFKGKDDDADWLLDGGILNKKLSIDPTKDLRDVWKVEAHKDINPWKKTPEPPAAVGEDGVRPVFRVFGEWICGYYGRGFTPGVVRDIQVRLAVGDCRPGGLHRTMHGYNFMIVAQIGLTWFHWIRGLRTVTRTVVSGDKVLTYQVFGSQVGHTATQRYLIAESRRWTELVIGRGVCLYGPQDAQVAIACLAVEDVEEDEPIDFEDDGDDDY
jgi:hypothetical protein